MLYTYDAAWNAGVPLLTPRLVDGEAEPGGAWAYGRLEVFDGLAFVTVSDADRNQELGRRGVLVACRTLRFATGGQALAGAHSALPDTSGGDGTVGNILCKGDEASPVDCETDVQVLRRSRRSFVYDTEDHTVAAIAIVYYNPSGTGIPTHLQAPCMLHAWGTAHPLTPLSCGVLTLSARAENVRA